MAQNAATFAKFFAPDLLDKVRAHPALRAHLVDPGFVATLKKLQADPSQLPGALDDPRVMQTMMAVEGQGELTFTPDDMREASRKGQLAQRPHPLQYDDLAAAAQETDRDACKARGNAAVGAKNYARALALYARALSLQAARDGAGTAAHDRLGQLAVMIAI
jgi:hypothetical protein